MHELLRARTEIERRIDELLREIRARPGDSKLVDALAVLIADLKRNGERWLSLTLNRSFERDRDLVVALAQLEEARKHVCPVAVPAPVHSV